MPRYLVHTVFLFISIFLVSFQGLRAIDESSESEGLTQSSGLKALKNAAEVVQRLKPIKDDIQPEDDSTEIPNDITIFDSTSPFAKLLWFPTGTALKNKFHEILKRLTLPGEKIFFYRRTATLAPWSNLLSSRVWRKINTEDKERYTADSLAIGLGLLSLIQSEDELAAIISAQLAAESPDLKFFHWKKQIPWVQEFTHWIDHEISKMVGSDQVDPQFKNAIISDIQAIERLIQAGYNPNALIELHNKVSHWIETTKKVGTQQKLMQLLLGKAYLDLSNRPNQELRMGAMKNYLFYRIRSSKIQHLLTQKVELNNDLKLLSYRATMLSTLFASKWTRYLLITALASGLAYLGVSLIQSHLYIFSQLNRYLENFFNFFRENSGAVYTALWGLCLLAGGYFVFHDRNFAKFLFKNAWALTKFLILSPVILTVYLYKFIYWAGPRLGAAATLSGSWIKRSSIQSYQFFKNDFSSWSKAKWNALKKVSNSLMASLASKLRKGTKRVKTEISGFISLALDIARLGKAFTQRSSPSPATYQFSDQSRKQIIKLLNGIRSVHETLENADFRDSFIRKKFGAGIDLAKLQNLYKELKAVTVNSHPHIQVLILSYISDIIKRDFHILLKSPDLASTIIDFLKSCDSNYFEDYSFKNSVLPFFEILERKVGYINDDLRLSNIITILSNPMMNPDEIKFEGWFRDGVTAIQYTKPFSYFLYQISNFQSLPAQGQFSILYFLSLSISEMKLGPWSFWPQLLKNIFEQYKSNFFINAFQPRNNNLEMLEKDIQKLNPNILSYRVPKKDGSGPSVIEIESIISIMRNQLSLSYSQLDYLQFLRLSSFIELLYQRAIGKIGPRDHLIPRHDLEVRRNKFYSHRDKIANQGTYHELIEFFPKSEQFGENLHGMISSLQVDLNALLIKYSKQSLSDIDRIGWYAAYRQISLDTSKTQSYFWNSERQWFIHFLMPKFQSVSELSSWISDVLISHQIPIEGLIADFYKLVFDHPEWMKSKEDIEALTQSKFFWPKKNSLGKQATPMEQAILESIEKHSSHFSEYWQVEPAAAEALHQRIIDFVKSQKIYGDTFDEQFEFWKTLSARGVTSTTDALFEKLWERADETQKSALSEEALKGRIWDLPLKVSLVRLQVQHSKKYRRLISNSITQEEETKEENEEDTEHDENPPSSIHDLLQRDILSSKEIDPTTHYLLRRNYILSLIKMIQTALPERGIGYFSILEDLANQIHANREETGLIEKAKYGGNLPSEQTQDYAVRTLSNVLEHVLSWKLPKQFDFILFLRGDIEPNAFIREQFNVVGPERVRRMFQILPLEGRAGILESFLSSPRGLLSSVNLREGYAKIFIDHLLKDGSDASQEVGKQVLEAFLYAMEKTGHQNYRSYVFSYLLGMLKNNQESSTGAVLKRVLETFGATGVKIGQFLAISGILPESENKYLEELQDKAKIPERHHLYQELDEITGLNPFPFDIEEILGSASLKYALRATDQKSKESFVLKVLRKESEVHVETEFAQLHHMADYLVTRNGARYGIFRAIIKASQKAVERELKLTHEAEMSKVARKRIYNAKPHPKVRVAVPLEFTMAPRLMASQFAPGSSFRELAPEWKPLAAEAILRLEVPNLFQDSGTTQLSTSTDFAFDPDRHAGNYRIQVLKNNPDGDLLSLVPIDFGQVLLMKAEERNQFFDLFALSGILNKTGSTVWASQKIQAVLKIQSPDFVAKIQKQLPLYFSTTKAIENPLSAYYALLAALEDAGSGLDIQFFDFPRAIAQLSRYTKHVPHLDPTLNPEARLREEALKRGEIFKADMEAHIAQTDGIKGKIIQEHLTGKISRSSKVFQSLGSCANWIKKFKKG